MLNAGPLAHRHNNFDFVRLFAACAVLFSHQFALMGLPEPLVLKYQTLGGFGVLIFFSISGYLIAQSWESDPHLWRFAARRLLRIWPGLLCTVVLCALVLGPLVTTVPLREYFTSPQTISYFQILLLKFQPYLPGVFPNSPVAGAPNGVLWTIPIEVRCYGYLALLGLLGIFRLKWAMLALLAAASVYYYGVYDAESVFDSGQRRMYELEYATFFFAGVALHLFRHAWAAPSRKIGIMAILAMVSGIFVATGHELVATFVATPFAVVAFGSSSYPVVRRFGRFGDLSYGVYIYAFPVQQTTLWLWGNKAGFWPMFGLAGAITFVLAFFSWHWVEKRALKLKPRKHEKKSRYDGAQPEGAGSGG